MPPLPSGARRRCRLAPRCGRTGGEGDSHRDLELRVILLDLPRAVLVPESFDDVTDPGGALDRHRPGAPLVTASGQLHRPGLEYVLVPLRARAFHGKQVERPAVLDEPDGTRTL